MFVFVCRGAFGDAAISDLYPKLLKRLDDSSDIVRIAIAHTLIPFMQCGGNAQCYSSTMVDYTLDQLFIHLDDANPVIQECMLKIIVEMGNIDKKAVLKKTETARLMHRTPTNCNRIADILQLGYEVL